MPADPSRPLVLVVDDDDVTRLLASETLEGAGFAVAEAADGLEALAVHAARRPELVLLDVNMPRLGGHETCRRLRESPAGAGTSVLMMTATDDVEAVEQAFQVGATDFLTKPLNLPLLAHRVQYLLRAARAFHAEREQARLLGRVQRLARLAHWRLHGGAFSWEGDVGAALWAEAGSPRPALPELRALVHPDDRALVEAAMASGGHKLDFRIVLPDGSVRLVHQDAEVVDEAGTAVLIGATQDITELRAAEQRVAQLAFFDDLTGLPSRAFLHRYLRRVLADRHDGGEDVAVLSVVTSPAGAGGSVSPAERDELRRAAAARVLTQVEGEASRQRLDQPVGDPDRWDDGPLVTRPGSDELIIVLRGEQAADGTRLARRLTTALGEVFRVGGRELYMTPVVGIASAGELADEPRAMIGYARAAVAHARATGVAVQQFSAELREASRREAELEQRLRTEVARLRHPERNHGFTVHYQPRVDRGTGRVVGVEALVRWQPEGGPPVPPDQFIPIAERSSAITTIGMWVLAQACAQGAAWAAAGMPIPVSVNVSANQFGAPGFVEEVVATAVRAGLNLELLELEITEHATVHDVNQAARILHQLRACGVRVALDDFGVGQSSLSQLAGLPIDIVKIDRSFTAKLGEDRACDAIVSAVMALAERLAMGVVVEGVETADQVRLLGRYPDCQVQGYFCSRPLPPEELAPFLARPFAWPEDDAGGGLEVVVDDEVVAA